MRAVLVRTQPEPRRSAGQQLDRNRVLMLIGRRALNEPTDVPQSGRRIASPQACRSGRPIENARVGQHHSHAGLDALLTARSQSMVLLTVQLGISTEDPGLLEWYPPFARQIRLQAWPFRNGVVQCHHARQLRQLPL